MSGKQSSDVNHVSLLGLQCGTRQPFENQASCEAAAGRSEILALRK